MKPVDPNVNLDDLFKGATEIIGREALEKKMVEVAKASTKLVCLLVDDCQNQ